MASRRFAPLVLALAVLGCQTDIPNEPPPSTLVFAISFPSCSDGSQVLSAPSPNDLALRAFTAPTPAQCTPLPPSPTPQQIQVLQAAVAGKGFPAQLPNPAPPPAALPLPITIQLLEVSVSTSPSCGSNFLPVPPTPAAIPFPDLDTATVTPSTLALVRYDTAPSQVPFAVAGYDRTTGLLTILNAQGAVGAPWASSPIGGRYVVALRGGPNGVKTKTGQSIAAQSSTFLVAQDKDLTRLENQTTLRACITDPNDATQAAVLRQTVDQLVLLQSFYGTPVFWTAVGTPAVWTPAPPGTPGVPTLPASPFAAVDTVFPHSEIASIQTFVIAPTP